MDNFEKINHSERKTAAAPRPWGCAPRSPKGSTLPQKCLAISCRWQGRDSKAELYVGFVYDRLAIKLRNAN